MKLVDPALLDDLLDPPWNFSEVTLVTANSPVHLTAALDVDGPRRSTLAAGFWPLNWLKHDGERATRVEGADVRG